MGFLAHGELPRAPTYDSGSVGCGYSIKNIAVTRLRSVWPRQLYENIVNQCRLDCRIFRILAGTFLNDTGCANRYTASSLGTHTDVPSLNFKYLWVALRLWLYFLFAFFFAGDLLYSLHLLSIRSLLLS